MSDSAEHYTRQGLILGQSGRHEEAIDFFNKAIELDPANATAYLHRGQIHLQLNNIVRGNTDIQKAKDIRSGKLRPKIEKKPISKISINEIENIYDSVFPENFEEQDDATLEFDDSFYDSVFTDDAIESDEAWDGIIQPAPEQDAFPAIIEFLGGERQEATGAILFKPTQDDISLLRRDGYVERVIPLEQLACIRMADIPARVSTKKDEACYIEIIETIDGSIFHEAIPPEQNFKNLLLGLSTKEQTRYPYTLIPAINIKKRCQQRYLGDILLEKRFIANDILKRALDEHQHEKSMKLGKIIAQKTQVLYSTIEKELKKAKKGKTKGLKTGEILLNAGLVSEEQILDALDYQENMQNMKIGEFLVEKGIINEREVYMALAEKFRTPFVDLRKQKVSKKTLTFLPRQFVLHNEILPIEIKDDTITVATIRPGITSLCETILKKSKCKKVHCVLVQPTHLRNIINLLYNKIGLGK